MGKVVGIDLGTTFSAIAHVNDDYGQWEIIPNAEGDRTTPSVILFADNNVVVGKIAKQQAKAMPDQIVEFVKREMGKPVGISESENEFSFEFDGKAYSAEELSALIIEKLKKDAEARLKTEITDAVITVPAYFMDAERQATRNAGEIAGLNVLRVLNEPTAAALTYGLGQQGNDQTVFVFDLGGGTFDVTIMKISESKLEMIATDGDHRLGGKDWDDRIITYVADMFETEHGVNPLDDNFAYQSLQLESISVKEFLSTLDVSSVLCQYDGKSSNVELTREQFEELTADLLERCRQTCENVLSEKEMTWDDIDTVLLVGGSTRMPMIQNMLTNISGKEINPTEVNPDDTVALGAAIDGVIRQFEEITRGDSATSTAEDISDGAIDRIIGLRGTKKIEVIDGATHNMGLTPVKDVDGQHKQYIHVMIPKMTRIPCEVVSEDFGTIEPNQDNILIEIVEGLEQDQFKDEIPEFEAFKLGECILDLPPNLPQGTTIKVTFKYNLDQTLEVTAEGPDGRTANATIERPTLDEAEVKSSSKHLKTLNIQ